jgi:hypothetical protein
VPYPNVVEFSKCKQACFFCDSKLKCRLTNFIGLSNDLPIINAHPDGDVISFDINHITPSYQIKADVTLDIKTNILTFMLKSESETPGLDAAVVRSAFSEMRPHIQLYCSSRKCRYQYTVASDIIRYMVAKSGWVIAPLDLYYESFVTGNLWVQNDYTKQKVNIYSRFRVDAEPITNKLMDFQAMGKEKVLNRIKTLVVFS